VGGVLDSTLLLIGEHREAKTSYSKERSGEGL